MRSRAGDDQNEQEQLSLPFRPIRNSEFLSNHWLEHRLPLEPEWNSLQDRAKEAVQELITLWRVERDRAEKYGDEAGLEEKLIQPVFEALGWQLKYQTFLQGRGPDYALFLTVADLDRALDAGRNSPDFWSHAALVADAKAWHINLDRPSRVGARREYPPEQIEWYLDRSRKDFGILTNGRIWRLVPRELGPNKPRFQTYLEVDLVRLLDEAMRPSAQLQLGPGGGEFDSFLRFFLFFSPHGFESLDGRKPLVTRAIEGSSEYSLGVGEELKERVFEALRLCVQGFIKYEPNGLAPSADLSICQEHGFILLYRLLFIMYAEDRGLLPYRINPTYTRNRSLGRHRDEVAAKLNNVRRRLDADYSREATNIWDDLQDLFDLIDRGHRSYGVPAYNGGLFSVEGDSFLAEKKLPDWYLARVLDQLGRAPQPDRPDLGLFRVDYRDLAIQQLGSVYEGLLELKPRYAETAMKVVRKRQSGSREELVLPIDKQAPRGYEATDLVYDIDSIYLATDKGERRSSGSYYTPDHIVNHMVEATLGPLCADVNDVLQSEIGEIEDGLIQASGDAQRAALTQRLQALSMDYDDRVLRLKVLDPAMGSGHFLIRACQYLAEEIATNPNTGHPEAEAMQSDESTITYWKRQVAEKCLFGVDLNPMAVELAKLALWLETIAANAPLTFLDHHLQCGDSIIGSRVDWLNNRPGDKGLLNGEFEQQVNAALPVILEPLTEISAMPSDTAEQVKRKERIFKGRFVPALRRFASVADLWCASVVAGQPVSSENYSRLVGALESQRRFDPVKQESWAKDCFDQLVSLGIRCFHWELAFPQVFFSTSDGASSGFDAIIGNPPYDVLSEKEAGAHVVPLQKFIEGDQSLEPSCVGKNNLYKLFICRSLELLRSGGYLSFIAPMALLGDEQASGVRKALLGLGRFNQVHAFPQKDSPERRVFYDAKLSTALFVYRKGKDDTPEEPFESAVHPAQYIETSSPALMLRPQDIHLYDPSNMTIVCCSQDDWDLATSIPRREGIGRLGDYCKSYQGEVNETTQKKFLHEADGEGRQLVLRGANVCLYTLREASQGEPLYIDTAAFRAGKRPGSKAFHGLAKRVGFQRSSPQNNFRRVIAASIPAGELCFDTVSYIPEKESLISADFLLALLNSKLIDWYFRLGSTNSKVNEYQFDNLPCPIFRKTADEGVLTEEISRMLETDVLAVPDAISPSLASGPFSPDVRTILEQLARKICTVEQSRGGISRNERSHLDPSAQPFQDAIDLILFKMVGLTQHQIAGIEERLSRML